MSSNSYGRIRRDGREAFDPFSEPEELNPYKSGGISSSSAHWMRGWMEAEDRHKEAMKAEKEEEEDWFAVSHNCPWYDGEYCAANQEGCTMYNCAPYYFIRG